MAINIKGIWQPPHYKFSDKPKEYKKALEIIVSALEEVGLDCFVYGGLLLGWIRDNDIIPWDDDIDLAIRDCDLDKFSLAVDNIRNKGFKINPYFGGKDEIVSFDAGPHRLGPLVDKDRCRIRVLNDNEEVIINSGYRSCYFKPFNIKVEINVFYKVGNYYYWLIEDPTTPKITTFRLPAKNIDTLETFDYSGKKYLIPSNSEEVLQLHFGNNWRSPRPGDDTCNHMYENQFGEILK